MTSAESAGRFRTERWELIGDFGLENLRRVEADIDAPGDHQVLVANEALSLNYRDLLMVSGRYNPRQPLPLVPGSDAAGRVVAVGRSVTRVAVGDRVVPSFSQSWLEGDPDRGTYATTLGGPLDGTFCRHQLLSEEGLVKIPATLSTLAAATLPCAGVTAWNALFGLGVMQSGDTVLVLGTGGVALFALQFATRRGGRVFITSSRRDKLDRAADLGAVVGINYLEVPDWGRRVRQLTDGVGVDHVVELGGAATLGQSLEAVRPGGTVSLIGNLGGNEAPLSVIPILMRQIRVQGVMVGSRSILEALLADLGPSNAMASEDPFEPIIDQVFDFAQLPAAFSRLAGGSHFGKVCLRIEGSG